MFVPLSDKINGLGHDECEMNRSLLTMISACPELLLEGHDEREIKTMLDIVETSSWPELCWKACGHAACSG